MKQNILGLALAASLGLAPLAAMADHVDAADWVKAANETQDGKVQIGAGQFGAGSALVFKGSRAGLPREYAYVLGLHPGSDDVVLAGQLADQLVAAGYHGGGIALLRGLAIEVVPKEGVSVLANAYPVEFVIRGLTAAQVKTLRRSSLPFVADKKELATGEGKYFYLDEGKGEVLVKLGEKESTDVALEELKKKSV